MFPADYNYSTTTVKTKENKQTETANEAKTQAANDDIITITTTEDGNLQANFNADVFGDKVTMALLESLFGTKEAEEEPIEEPVDDRSLTESFVDDVLIAPIAETFTEEICNGILNWFNGFLKN